MPISDLKLPGNRIIVMGTGTQMQSLVMTRDCIGILSVLRSMRGFLWCQLIVARSPVLGDITTEMMRMTRGNGSNVCWNSFWR